MTDKTKPQEHPKIVIHEGEIKANPTIDKTSIAPPPPTKPKE